MERIWKQDMKSSFLEYRYEKNEAGSQKGHYSLRIFKKQEKDKVSEKGKDEHIRKGFRFSSSKDPPTVRRKAGELFSESAENKKDECRGKDSLIWINEDKDETFFLYRSSSV